MNGWYSNIYKALLLASVITFVISLFSSGTVAFGSILAGYSILTMSVMMLLIILFTQILKVTQGQGILKTFYTMFISTGPFILMLGIIGFIMYLIINYKNIIIDQHVSSSYYTFSNLSIILMLIQLYIVYTNVSSDKFESAGKISSVTGSLLYLLGLLTACCALIMFTVLKYYTTDGFSVINK
jgi:hypothetical protein